jgi:hypothetical protein
MANPNIVNVATINGESQGLALGTGDSNVIIAAISSSKVVKVNRITVANVDGTNAADVSVKVVKAAFTSAATGGAGNVGTIYLAKTISVPADASLVLLDTPIYMQEGDALQGGASATGDLELFVSYDVIA